MFLYLRATLVALSTLCIGSVAPSSVAASSVVVAADVRPVAAAVSSAAAAGPQLISWGDGRAGQLGDGRRFGQLTPGLVDSGALSGRTVDALYTGYSGSCATSSGTLVCWGANARLLGDTRAQAETPTSVPIEVDPQNVFTGKTITAVGLGGFHLCAVASNDLYCWGGTAVAPVPGPRPDVTVPIGRDVFAGRTLSALAVGANHTCVIAEAELYCFGLNDRGQLGDGTTDPRYTPTLVGGALAGKQVTAVAAGEYRTCAVADGDAYCWGSNIGGALGDGSRIDRLTPQAVSSAAFGGEPVTQVAVGTDHACAVAGGAAFCWGYGGYGQLGAGPDVASSLTPAAVTADGALAGREVTSVTASFRSSCAVASGSAFCWGANESGELGVGVEDGKTVLVSTVPLPVATAGTWGSDPVTTLNAPSSTACALVQGRVWCWGSNEENRTGDPRPIRAVPPFSVPLTGALASAQITQIAAGEAHSCMIADELPYCWGAIATTSPELFSAVPYPVDTDGVLTGKTLSQLSSGDGMSCVLADGLPYCWGVGAFRAPVPEEPGADGSTSEQPVDPTPIAIDTAAFAGRPMTALSVGGQTACGVADGQVYCWGEISRKLGRADQTTPYVPALVDGTDALSGKTVTAVAVGSQHVCAIADGNPYCWGPDYRGTVGGRDAPYGAVAIDISGALAGLTATSVAVGPESSCVIADGRVFCWGEATMLGGLYGEQGDSPVPVEVLGQSGLAGHPVTSLSIGAQLACGVADGEAYCWGYRSSSRYGPPEVFDLDGATGGAAVSAVSIGQQHALALALPLPGTVRPIGVVDTGTLNGPAFRIDGWAIDPDTAESPVAVDVQDRRPDGTSTVVRVTADGSRPDVAAAYPGAGAAHGFSASIALTVAGVHEVCASAVDSEIADARTLIGCRTVELPGPVGVLDVARMTDPGVLSVQGWVAQPGATDLDTEVHVYVTAPDGTVVGYPGIMTGIARPDVTAALGWPDDHTGFSTSIPVTQTGTHQVCAFGIGTTRGTSSARPPTNTLLGCRSVEVRNAFGNLDEVIWQAGALHVRGWSLNPNATGGPVEIHVYDFGPAGAVGTPGLFTGVDRPDVLAVFPGLGDRPGFDLTVQTTGAGLHTVCAFGITTSGGTGNVLLGCRDVTVG